jgi:DNA invertase Pin-like site-specific DNA recombinase
MSAEEIAFMMIAQEMGIIPFCKTAEDFRDAMGSVSPEERRKIKRKFRKAWRKIAKSGGFLERRATPGKKPNTRTRRARQYDVLGEIRRKARREVRKDQGSSGK